MSYGKEIFVFGSNLAGVHGAGAAQTAYMKHGAKWGVGEGIEGNSYALPTKDYEIQSLSLWEINNYVDRFLDVAKRLPNHKFVVTAIGCGLAGYKVEEIAPMFAGCPSNVFLPTRFIDCLKNINYNTWGDQL